MIYQRLILIILVLFNVYSDASQSEKRIEKPVQIVVDGKLNESQWQNAQNFDDFVMTYPQTSQPGRWSTQAKVLSDKKGIYIGFINAQKKSTQADKKHARDDFSYADYASVTIDFDGAGINAYEFTVSLGNSIKDAVHFNENQVNFDWDGLWTSATSSEENLWFAEIFIPWAIAPFGQVDKDNRNIRFYFKRWIQNDKNLYSYPDAIRIRPRFLSDFATLNVPNYKVSSFHITPYMVLGRDFTQQKNDTEIGLDLFYKPDSDKQLTATFNPDFGQVEADELIVNFSAIETLRTDKRLFFTENQALFQVTGSNNLALVHTRRVGGSPDIGPASNSDVLGAAKGIVIGQNVDYGFFAAIEDDSSQAQGRQFYTGRWLYKGEDGTFGQLFSLTDSPTTGQKHYTNAFDLRYQPSETHQLKGLLFNSNTERQTGVGVDFNYSHHYQKHWINQLNLHFLDKKVDLNDLGFMNRNNIIKLSYNSSYELPNLPVDGSLQQRKWVFNADYSQNNQGDQHPTNLSFQWEDNHKNTSAWLFTVQHQTRGIDDLLTRGNGNVQINKRDKLGIKYTGSNRNAIQFNSQLNWFQEGLNGWAKRLNVSGRYFFNTTYSTDLTLTYTDSNDWLIWQQNTLTQFSRDMLQLSWKVDAKISEKQELKAFVQWFVLDANARQSFNTQNNGQITPVAHLATDFNSTNLALQVRYRYELAPLSNFYLVYSRGASIFTHQPRSYGALLNDAFATPDTNKLQAKVSYRF